MDRLTFDEPQMPAVFVLSAPRSGSTLLRYVLDTHSRIASPGEIFLARLCFDLELALSRTAGAGLPPGRATEERLAAETRRVVAGVMESYARSKGKSLWCDKSPRNVEYLPSLARTFPRGRYVCLYRNCLDTVKSMLTASQQGFMLELAPYAAKSPNNLVAAMIDAWCDYTGKILDFEAAHPGQVFRLRYEDMVLEPEAALRPLFAFLEVAWEPEVVAARARGAARRGRRRPLHQVHPHDRPLVARQGLDDPLLPHPAGPGADERDARARRLPRGRRRLERAAVALPAAGASGRLA